MRKLQVRVYCGNSFYWYAKLYLTQKTLFLWHAQMIVEDSILIQVSFSWLLIDSFIDLYLIWLISMLLSFFFGGGEGRGGRIYYG